MYNGGGRLVRRKRSGLDWGGGDVLDRETCMAWMAWMMGAGGEGKRSERGDRSAIFPALVVVLARSLACLFRCGCGTGKVVQGMCRVLYK